MFYELLLWFQQFKIKFIKINYENRVQPTGNINHLMTFKRKEKKYYFTTTFR